ncbi:alpha/beta hydrolase [Sinorhizobium psoraleae]|uniref:alpha/beta hydrolase n=1 Tax=Sinorhizobium psoraleae TaxID=520838 RepID=UPI0035E3BD5D
MMRVARVGVAILIAVSFVVLSSRTEARSSCSQRERATIELPDPVSGRQYEIYVSLPAGYSENRLTSYPLVIIADGGRAFPELSCDAWMLAESKAIGPAIVVGLSYALGENLADSRRRDYTPSPLPGSGKVYGGAAAYQRYLRDVVVRYVEDRYRIASDRRIFWGHSYGGLLGLIFFSQIRPFSRPIFSGARPSGLERMQFTAWKQMSLSANANLMRRCSSMPVAWRHPATILHARERPAT